MSPNVLEILGYFCWWTIRQVNIAREDLQAALVASGVDYQVPEMRVRTAFLKAIREVQRTEKGVMIRKIKKAANEYVFGLVDESIDQRAKSLGYYHSSTVTFNPETGSMSCDFPSRVYEQVQAAYNRCLENMDSDDVREIVLQILQQEWRISVRDRGGIYFLPRGSQKKIEALRNFVDSLGEECAFQVVPQVDVEATRNAIYKSFLEEVKGEIASFREEIEEKGDSKRNQPKMWSDRIAQFKELKEKVSFYADILKFQGQAMSDDLDSLEKQVKEKFLAGS